MIFVKTFKGYDDKTAQLDDQVNKWIGDNRVDVVDIKAVLAHDPSSRSQLGDVLYVIQYNAERALF
jgi:hypothetical protein